MVIVALFLLSELCECEISSDADEFHDRSEIIHHLTKELILT